MISCRLKRARTFEELLAFIQCNPQVDVPLDYLQSNEVYVLIKNREVIGGFVYGQGPGYRYVERMNDPALRKQYQTLFANLQVAELTILWLKKRYRKTIYSLLLWTHVALKSFLGPADYIVFGTSVPILIQALDYPQNTAKLVTYELKQKYQEKYGLGALSLFLVERRRALWSMAQGVYFLLFRPTAQLRKTARLAPLLDRLPHSVVPSSARAR